MSFPGRYAIAVMHDINGNGAMDTNLLGIPTEPRGNSGERATFKPSFKGSQFEVKEQAVQLRIQLH